MREGYGWVANKEYWCQQHDGASTPQVDFYLSVVVWHVLHDATVARDRMVRLWRAHGTTVGCDQQSMRNGDRRAPLLHPSCCCCLANPASVWSHCATEFPSLLLLGTNDDQSCFRADPWYMWYSHQFVLLRDPHLQTPQLTGLHPLILSIYEEQSSIHFGAHLSMERERTLDQVRDLHHLDTNGIHTAVATTKSCPGKSQREHERKEQHSKR